MQRGDWWALIGIIVAIVLGIPSVPLFAQGNIVLASVALILFMVLLGLTYYTYWIGRLPPWTVMAFHFHAEILDTAGRTARARKTVKLRANHPGLEYYTHRNISADGTVTFQVDGDVTLESQQVIGGDYVVRVRFPTQIKRWSQVNTWLEETCTGTFTTTSEGIIGLVDLPMKRITLEVTLPADRPSRSARVIYRYSGKEEELDPPTVNGNRLVWTRGYRFRELPFGEYELRWSW
jgi:hypothetical protein